MMLMLSLILWAYTDPKDLIQQPIPDSVWEIKVDPDQNIHDAVILQDFTKLTLTRTERYMRVLILSESGKEAAEIIDPTGTLKLVGGKVTDSRGNVTVFDKNEDLVETLSHKIGRRSDYKRILVPPALTPNCVVDIAWYEASDEGIPTGEYVKRYDVRRPYFAKQVQYVIDPTALRDSGNYYASRFSWFNGNGTIPFEQAEDGKATILTWTDVPALEPQPFGVMAYDEIQAYVISYRVTPGMVTDANRFWRDFSQQIYKPMLQVKFRGSKEFEQWLDEIKTKLPQGDPIAALDLVANEFRNRYHCTDLLPPEKRARYVDHDTKTSDKVLYREITKHGFADPYLISRLFFTVLEKLDIEPKIVLANSFYNHPFIAAEMNMMSLNIFYPSFGYQREDGSWYLYNPGYSEYEPGETPAQFQGTNALIIDTANKWAVSFSGVPRQAPSQHRVVREYTASLDENLLMKQQLKTSFTGSRRANFRQLYFPLPADEKVEELKKSWEDRLPASGKVTDASLQNLDTLTADVGYTVSWQNQYAVEEEAGWFRYIPFRGSYTPLYNDDIWSKERTQPIVMPYAFDNYDKATLTVPAGFKLVGDPSWKKQNGVGTVILQAFQKGNTIVTERRIILAVDIIGKEHVDKVREFLAWIEEAESQRLAIERSQS